MEEMCVCGCDRPVSAGSSFYDEEECSLRYNPNDVPYEKED
ncbi:hypothetical protein [Paenibacillus sp. FSL H7-0331]|nr:hypothetical protein [Paenibacillus sp. FSL H7-0331]